YASGFWGFVTIPAGVARDEVVLKLSAILEDGAEIEKTLSRIVVEPEPSSRATAATSRSSGERPLVSICMATYNPPADLVKRQKDSISAETYESWICVISDDHSSQESFRGLKEVLGDDPRFSMSRSERRLGFYRNFERAVRLTPPEASYIALSDQDDVWHKD